MEKYKLLLFLASVLSAVLIVVVAYAWIKKQTITKDPAVQPLQVIYLTVK
jgi:hypothetical protein